MKIAYIITGFRENHGLYGYREIKKFLESYDVKVVEVKVSWKNKTMADYVNDFKKQLKHDANDEIYLLGFSFGAMISLIAASEINPKALVLCSLSPYFQEDIKHLKKSWVRYIGKNRLDYFTTLSFNNISEEIKLKTILIVGENEPKEVVRRVEDAHLKISNAELIIAKGARHNISQREYLSTVLKVIADTLG